MMREEQRQRGQNYQATTKGVLPTVWSLSLICSEMPWGPTESALQVLVGADKKLEWPFLSDKKQYG